MTSQLPLHDDLPLLTDVVNESANDLPMLTDIVERVSITNSPVVHEISPQLLRELEAHLESVYLQKLGNHLADAQQRAVEQALSELKSELPQLVQDALNPQRKLL